jgi:hypothetical protein
MPATASRAADASTERCAGLCCHYGLRVLRGSGQASSVRKGGGQARYGASAPPVFGHATYVAITALILSLAVSAGLTVVSGGSACRRIGETRASAAIPPQRLPLRADRGRADRLML